MNKYNFLFLFSLFFLSFSTRENPLSFNSNPRKITLYWDSSMSMKDKNLDKEIAFLDNFFNHVTDVEVELISFSNTIMIDGFFKVNQSDWTSLKQTLLKIKYDGVAYFNLINENNLSDLNFLFTDGIEVIDKLKINFKTPTYIINSSSNTNDVLLKEQSFNSNGSFINLSKTSIKDGLTLLDIDNLEDIVIKEPQKTSTNKSQKVSGEISGTIFSSEDVLAGATVKVKSKNTGVVTDENGKFKIKVTKGDILIINYLGTYKREVVIDDINDLSILLIDKNNELGEVVVKGQKKVEDKVNLGSGEKNKEKIGYAVQTIESEDLSDANPSNVKVLGKFSGVTSYGQNDDISQIVLRANSLLLNVYPLIVINGSPVSRSSSVGRLELSNFLNPDDIATISILKGLAATNRWGSEGSNGVILITTKTGTYTSAKDSKPYDKALLRNNNYTETLKFVKTSVDKKYIKELKKFKTLNDVYDAYLKQRNEYLNNVEYFVNVSELLAGITLPGSKELSTKILSNILELNPGDVEFYRLTAYKAEQEKDFIFAKHIYQKIAELKPSESQSYRDLALINQETKNFQESLDIYNKIENNKYANVNFSGLKKNISNEMKRLLLHHKNKLKLTGVPSGYLNIQTLNYDARIVFDWNKRDAEFELQFVNPQKKFFTWSHTNEQNAFRLNQEQVQGFNSEEFLLVGAQKGQWIINVENKSLNSKKPVIIKYTVYKNFGKPTETKETKVLILNNIKEKQTLGKIII